MIFILGAGRFGVQYEPDRLGKGIRIHAVATAVSIIVPFIVWTESRSCTGCLMALPFAMFYTSPFLLALFIWAEKNVTRKRRI